MFGSTTLESDEISMYYWKMKNT